MHFYQMASVLAHPETHPGLLEAEALASNSGALKDYMKMLKLAGADDLHCYAGTRATLVQLVNFRDGRLQPPKASAEDIKSALDGLQRSLEHTLRLFDNANPAARNFLRNLVRAADKAPLLGGLDLAGFMDSEYAKIMQRATSDRRNWTMADRSREALNAAKNDDPTLADWHHEMLIDITMAPRLVDLRESLRELLIIVSVANESFDPKQQQHTAPRRDALQIYDNAIRTYFVATGQWPTISHSGGQPSAELYWCLKNLGAAIGVPDETFSPKLFVARAQVMKAEFADEVSATMSSAAS